jgi:hypothetical protein
MLAVSAIATVCVSNVTLFLRHERRDNVGNCVAKERIILKWIFKIMLNKFAITAACLKRDI